MALRRCPTSPPPLEPATPLDDEDLLAEILLRLPPLPSSLPRAAAVSRRWRRIVTDAGFRRRFRSHHGKAPLLGFFDRYGSFIPTVEAPDRVPARFSMGGWEVVGCRHGLVLCKKALQFQVIDPMTGDRSVIPAVEGELLLLMAKAVVAGIDRRSFRLVVVFNDYDRIRFSASIYSSDSGVWDISVATLTLPFSIGLIFYPGTLVDNAIYWLHDEGGILRYDMERQNLAVIELPPYEYIYHDFHFQIMSAALVLLSWINLASNSGIGRQILAVLQTGCCTNPFNWMRSFPNDWQILAG
uniref:F-box domain-containing protein n=1 Tax=Arundo donax TaxID=35708 RepID=A0A0A9F208_ARUDO